VKLLVIEYVEQDIEWISAAEVIPGWLYFLL